MCLGCHKHKTSTRGSTKAIIGEVNPEQSAAVDTGKAHHRVGFQQFFFFFLFFNFIGRRHASSSKTVLRKSFGFRKQH